MLFTCVCMRAHGHRTARAQCEFVCGMNVFGPHVLNVHSAGAEIQLSALQTLAAGNVCVCVCVCHSP